MFKEIRNLPHDVLKAFNEINAPVFLRRFTVERTGATEIDIQYYNWRDKDLFDTAQTQIEFIKTIAGILSDDLTAELIRALQGGEEYSDTVGFINSFNMIYNSVAVTFTVKSHTYKAVVFTHTVDHLKDATENKTPYLPPAQHGNIVDHVAGILAYCAFSKHCEDMCGSDIKSRLIELVGPDIVKKALIWGEWKELGGRSWGGCREDKAGGLEDIVRVNNNAIVSKLQDAIALQKRTMATLDEYGFKTNGASNPRLPTTKELLSDITNYIEDGFNTAIRQGTPVDDIVRVLQNELTAMYPHHLIQVFLTSLTIVINGEVDCVKYGFTVQDKVTWVLLMSRHYTYNRSQN